MSGRSNKFLMNHEMSYNVYYEGPIHSRDKINNIKLELPDPRIVAVAMNTKLHMFF